MRLTISRKISIKHNIQYFAVVSEQRTEMSFWDHLDDLRKTLLRMVVVFACATLGLFFFKSFLFDTVVLAPSRNDFFLYRLLGVDMSVELQNIEVSAQFFIHMKVTLIIALLLTFPYLVYELWRFVAPALYKKEKKLIGGAFAFAGVLFYAGVALAYFLIFPLMINFFVNYQVSDLIDNKFAISSYISMLLSTALIFGLVFELPILISILSSIGLVTKQMLKKYRRQALCLIMILAAVITPSGDPFTLIICTIPIYLLYELSILICKNEITEDAEEE